MKKLFVIWNLGLFWILGLVICHLSFAQVVPSHVLIERAKEYDGWEIEFKGEVVGEVMKRGDFAWINLADSFKAIGVWISAEQAGQINYSGDYHHKGDIILIRGTFHRACPIHSGELDIHATRITKIRDGYKISHCFPKEKNEVVVILLWLLLFLSIIAVINQKKRRNYASRPSF